MPDSAAVPQEFISPRDLITKALDSLRPNSSPAPGPRLVATVPDPRFGGSSARQLVAPPGNIPLLEWFKPWPPVLVQ